MPYQAPEPMTPLSSYWLVVATVGGTASAQPRFSASAVRSVSRPWRESWPVVALPLLYSMRSGAWSELRTCGAVFWICSKPFSSNSTFTPGWLSSNSVTASAHALPMALSGPS